MLRNQNLFNELDLVLTKTYHPGKPQSHVACCLEIDKFYSDKNRFTWSELLWRLVELIHLVKFLGLMLVLVVIFFLYVFIKGYLTRLPAKSGASMMINFLYLLLDKDLIYKAVLAVCRKIIKQKLNINDIRLYEIRIICQILASKMSR